VYHAWQTGKDYEDQKGFCSSANVADIQKHDYVLTPGRYVGAEDVRMMAKPLPTRWRV
jgi:type I restriction enzyme M protein